MLSKRTTFTTISPLPPGVTREVVVEYLHNYAQMIDLNPLVKERHPIRPPPHATADEKDCVWYSITDKISYLPGGLADGDVTYTCAFKQLPNGIQTHCYAPAGLDIREKWTLNGTLPGEPPEPQELGIGAPATGLYLREDIDMRCNMIMTSFVRKTLTKAHGTLVDQIKAKAETATATRQVLQRTNTMSTVASPKSIPASVTGSTVSALTPRSGGFEGGLSPPLSGGQIPLPSPLSLSYQMGSPPPSYNPALYSPPAAHQPQKHQPQAYIYAKGQTGPASPPPPVPPKLPRDRESVLSDQLRQIYSIYRSESLHKAAFQQPQVPRPNETSEKAYSRFHVPQQQQIAQQQRRSSIATTPLSPTDRSLIPDPLLIRPKSSGKEGDRATREHPEYPMMNPYMSDAIKTPGGFMDSPLLPNRTFQPMPTRKKTAVEPSFMSASLSGPFIAELE